MRRRRMITAGLGSTGAFALSVLLFSFVDWSAAAETANREARAEARVERRERRPARRAAMTSARGRESASGARLRAAAAPTKGTASLTVDQQVHLGANTSVFIEDDLFVWQDGSSTAVGLAALSSADASASDNTALGQSALSSTTTGVGNTAVGGYALSGNYGGRYNTAVGYAALSANYEGRYNTALGDRALTYNDSGYSNVGIGSYALFQNTIGGYNIAVGTDALYRNLDGEQNVAVGDGALYFNTSGVQNIALGFEAGKNLGNVVSPGTSLSHNVFIGSTGSLDEQNTIRLGTPFNAGSGHDRIFVAGINGNMIVSGADVCIDTVTDQLGICDASSGRFKEEIREMGAASSDLLDLRPVTFRYREEVVGAGERPIEFGLIAEEVAAKFPSLVSHDKQGKPVTVRYQILSALLLNELQKQQQEISSLEARLVALETAP